jgi:NAD(P)H-quinone oxidoreductase subunit 5
MYSQVSLRKLITSFAGGLAAMLFFALVSNKALSPSAATSFVLFFAFIAGAQLMLTLLKSSQTKLNFIVSLIFSSLAGLMYGASIKFVQFLIPDVTTLQVPKLNLIHWAVMILFGALWASLNLGLHAKLAKSKLGCWLYINLFNLSQPWQQTVTTLRKNYNF